MTSAETAHIEAILRAALATMPGPTGLARADERIARAIAHPGRARLPSARWSWLSGRRAAALILVAVAAVAATGGMRLLDRMASNHPGWERAWDRAERLDLVRTSSGQTVVVERAYIDTNFLLIGITGEGYQPSRYELRVDGTPVPWDYGSFAQRHDRSAALWVSEAPPGIGETAVLDLEITELGDDPRNGRWRERVAGEWRYRFSLPNAGGASWKGPMTVTRSGVTAALDEVTVSPTMVKGHLRFRGERLAVAEDTWSPKGRIVHGDKRVHLGTGYGIDNEFTFTARDGYDDRRGVWRIIVDEIRADDAPGRSFRIAGPWTFEVRLEGPAPAR
jgi:hypothetical protein